MSKEHNPVTGYSKELVNGRIPVFVEKKLKMSTIKRKIRDVSTAWTESDVIPETIKGKKTKVIEIGRVSASVDRKKYRPLRGGIEIGPRGENTAGTLGLLVVYRTWRGYSLVGRYFGAFLRLLGLRGLVTDKRVGILTNSHVANASVLSPRAHQIVQPSMNHSSLSIGRVLYSVPVLADKANFVDAAIISISRGGVESPENALLGSSTVESFREPIVNERVHKRGRTTEYTTGSLVARNVTLNINFGPDGNIKFTGIDMYSNMEEKGDSGSVIIADSDGAAVGLLFAGSNLATFAIPMLRVAAELNIEPYTEVIA